VLQLSQGLRFAQDVRRDLRATCASQGRAAGPDTRSRRRPAISARILKPNRSVPSRSRPGHRETLGDAAA